MTPKFLAHPIENPAMRIETQGFGEHPDWYRGFSYNGVPLRGHNGVDFGIPLGTPIHATAYGIALEAGEDPAGGWGIYVKLRHVWGESLYAHLSSLDVAQGDVVTVRQLLGLSGSTGNSTGPHVHFGVRFFPYTRGDGWGGFSDPCPYLEG